MPPAYKKDGLTPDSVLQMAMKDLYVAYDFAAAILSPEPLPWELLAGVTPVKSTKRRRVGADGNHPPLVNGVNPDSVDMNNLALIHNKSQQEIIRDILQQQSTKSNAKPKEDALAMNSSLPLFEKAPQDFEILAGDSNVEVTDGYVDSVDENVAQPEVELVHNTAEEVDSVDVNVAQPEVELVHNTAEEVDSVDENVAQPEVELVHNTAEEVPEDSHDNVHEMHIAIPEASSPYMENLVGAKAKDQDNHLKAKVEDLKATNPWMTANVLPEAVIIIHGFWSNLDDACKSFGQMFAMCDLPPRFKLFAFDYPSGNPFGYHDVKRHTGSNGIRQDLTEMVRDLTRCGFNRFHFIAHSMGTRVFCQLAEVMADLFRPLPGTGLIARPDMKTGLPDPNLPVLKSIILIDGEFSLKSFKEKKFPILRRYCDLITMFCDVEDMALRGAEWFNKWIDKEADPRDIGKNPDQFWEPATDPEWEVEQLVPPTVLEIMDKAKDSPIEELKPDNWSPKYGPRPGFIDVDPYGYRGDPLLDPVHIELRVVPSDTGNNAQLDAITDVNMTLHGQRAKGRLFRSRAVKIAQYRPAFLDQKRYLDLDVIDNSHIDTNVSAIRHSTFVYNRTLTDDFRDIIVHGRRAIERGRAIRKQGNYFIPSIAPSYISAG